MPEKNAIEEKVYKCEVALCTRKADRLNETVRQKGTENVKIMNICRMHFIKITGAK